MARSGALRPRGVRHAAAAAGTGHPEFQGLAQDVPGSRGSARDVATSAEVARYIAAMARDLETLAQERKLNVLALILAMAGEQATDDAERGR